MGFLPSFWEMAVGRNTGPWVGGCDLPRPSPQSQVLRMGELLHTLVIGYGNLDRQDDGVAYHVVNALRRRLGQDALGEDETGLEALGAQVDSVFVTQLGTDLLQVAAGYGMVIFVDAHVRTDVKALHWEPVRPEYASATFTHHMTPALFLALLQALHHHQAEGHIVSIRGQSFDFGRSLTAAAEAWVQPAVDRLLDLVSGSESP
jgi:hydrogenase maturation protease